MQKAAATRLVEYWKQRKAFFGVEKAFQAMTMEGALSEDLEVLSKGMMMILPSNEAGQAVLFFDGAPSEILPRNKVVGICFATFLSITYGWSLFVRFSLFLLFEQLRAWFYLLR